MKGFKVRATNSGNVTINDIYYTVAAPDGGNIDVVSIASGYRDRYRASDFEDLSASDTTDILARIKDLLIKKASTIDDLINMVNSEPSNEEILDNMIALGADPKDIIKTIRMFNDETSSPIMNFCSELSRQGLVDSDFEDITSSIHTTSRMQSTAQSINAAGRRRDNRGRVTPVGFVNSFDNDILRPDTANDWGGQIDDTDNG